jgi:site-specific DNA-methyltransferase (adenine-specific)
MLSRMKFEIEQLVTEILDQLPESIWTSPTTTFFDPAIGGGQFVRAVEQRLRACGHSDSNIRGRVFGFEESDLHIRYAVNKYKLVGQYHRKPYDKFLEMDDSMKFDVVIGNPPYQDNAGQNTLYPKFYAKAVNLAKDVGSVAMITPPAIIPGLFGVKDPDGIKMPDPISINKIVIGNRVKKHFSGVASEFCYYILTNAKSPNSQVSIYTDAGSIVASGPLFPKIVDAKDIGIAQSIINKCFKFGNDPYKATSGDHGRSAYADPKGKDLAVESISTDGTVKTRKITWSKPHPHYNKPKIIMPLYGKVAHIDRTHKLVSAAQEKTTQGKLTGHNVCTILTNSDAESESVISLLESKLQRFFNMVTNENRSQYINFIKHFVGVPLKQVWTDQDLYQHFGLTKEEIEYIENAVK